MKKKAKLKKASLPPILTDAQREILYSYNYQFCPEALQAGTERERDQAMVRQWQINHETDLQPLIAQAHGIREHGTGLVADGDVGPATAWSFHMQRCGCPDYKDPDQKDPTILGATIAEANFPTGCRSELLWKHRIPNLNGLTQVQIRDGLRAAFKVWQDALVVGFLESQGASFVHFDERSANLGNGGVLARHLLAHNRCDSGTWGEYNTRVNWNLAMFIAVAAHEIGHGLGFDHVPGQATLMNPSITRGAIERGGRPIDADLRESVRKGYVLRADGPPPDDDKIVGRITMFLGNQTIVSDRIPFEVTGRI